MKKLLAIVAMLFVVFVVWTAPAFVYAAEVSIQKEVELKDPRIDTGQPENCIAIQAVWDQGISTWRRQVIPFNGATKSMITQEMRNQAAQIIPTRNGVRKWESWDFTIVR